MFGKKEKPKRAARPAGSLAQYGIFEVPRNLEDINTGFMEVDDDDDDLEAELAALTTGDDSGQKSRRTVRKPVPDEKLDAMVAESMKDINPDEEVSDGDDDSELLSELKMITGDESPEETSPEEEKSLETGHAEPPAEQEDTSMTEKIKLIEERLSVYKIAAKKAKEENESGKARRYNRGIKTLQELLSSAQAGHSINEADIPPQLPPSATADSTEKPKVEVDTPLSPVSENVPETDTVKTIDEETLNTLISRQKEFKTAAVMWKRAGNMKEALQCVNIAKQFDIVIAAVNAGDTVDLADMPPSPATPETVCPPVTPMPSQKEDEKFQQHSSTEPPSDTGELQPTGPTDLQTALKERLEIYRRSKTAAETEGNSSKARRYDRICKQFESALKLHARGKPVPLDELPTPPGFPPLFITPQSNVPAADTVKEENQQEPTPQVVSNSDPPGAEATLPKAPTPTRKAPVPPARTQIGKKPNQKTSRAEKQMLLLQERQRELKQAALAAKQDGDLELARDYLRQAKGIQPLIEASISGLPVDMNSIPLSPLAKIELNEHGFTGQTDDNFTLINNEDCLEEATGTDEQIYENLESQLIKQSKWCLSTRDHSKALGDVPGYNRWERLALGYTRDLDMLRVRKRDALPPPQHHYETKTYAIVQSCTDLGDSDIEISIIRGVNFSKEVDTYVTIEFPYPSDNPPTDKTSTIKGSCNPEYQAVFPLTGIIDRSSRQCQRAFKRHALKCQVWAKGCSLNSILCCTHPRGFFRSDSLLGTVTIKLQFLETHCILHDSFPLMEGRKATGGKLEVKMRLRNPILTKQIEQITDKWLTIDR